MVPLTNNYYKDGVMDGLCGNRDGILNDDNDAIKCKSATNYLHGQTIPEKCIEDP